MAQSTLLNVMTMFGAKGDGTSDDSAAVSSAIAQALSSGGTVFFPPASYKIASQITITLSSGQYLHIMGASKSSGLVQFQHPPAIRIIPPGGTTPAFRVTGVGAAGTTFENLASQGAGLAVFVDQTASVHFENCGFESTLASQSPVWIDDSFWVSFNRCSIIAPNTSTPAVRIRSKQNGTISSYLLHFDSTTFNRQGVEFTQVQDTAEQPGQIYFKYCHTENLDVSGYLLNAVNAVNGIAEILSTVTMDNCMHYDTTGGIPPFIRVKKTGSSGMIVRDISIRNCGESDGDAIIVTDGRVNGVTIQGARCAKKVTSSDSFTGYIRTKENGLMLIGYGATDTDVSGGQGGPLTIGRVNEANLTFSINNDGTQYWGPGGSTTAYDTNLSRTAAGALLSNGVVRQTKATPAYSASITPNAAAGDWQTITVTNGTAFTINAPTTAPASTTSQELAIEIFNNSGGAMGAITWNAAFKLVGGAFTNPANANKRFIAFKWNGANWIEQSRAGADYT